MNKLQKRKDFMDQFSLNMSQEAQTMLSSITIKKGEEREKLNPDLIDRSLLWARAGFQEDTDLLLLREETVRNCFDGMTENDISHALILAAVAFIERDPAYGYVAARLLFKLLYREVTTHSVLSTDVDHTYAQSFIRGIKHGVDQGLYDKRLLDFDLNQLSLSLVPERDQLFDYMGLRTLYERYFSKDEQTQERIELPQAFWMRIAMGLSLLEENKTERVLEFYNLISLMRYVPSTPTLLHSGLTRPQLSSCFLATVTDDLHHIFKCIGDMAQLAKWSGGVAYDWTSIRATGAWIKSIKTESQGVIPYLKVANDTIASINRSGRRRGAGVVYLETWHLEIEDFLDLRRNTGDERRRTHDMNTANWVPDLFMKRVVEDGDWTLFSPEEVPELHEIYGTAFEKRYQEYEQMAQEGTIKLFKVIKAKELWRKMLTRLFETGHPWITFKDACNIRSPQDHAGVIRSSNLCTEITLNTSQDETAVCNLGSVNLSKHIQDGAINYVMLSKTVETAMRMLDNVIDINFYPTKEGDTANMRHRPVGLGLMGFQDALYQLDISFADEQAKTIADQVMETYFLQCVICIF